MHQQQLAAAPPQAATPPPASAPAMVDLGYYRPTVGNARGNPTWIPNGENNPAPQIFRGPTTAYGAPLAGPGPRGAPNYYTAGSAPVELAIGPEPSRRRGARSAQRWRQRADAQHERRCLKGPDHGRLAVWRRRRTSARASRRTASTRTGSCAGVPAEKVLLEPC
jgi:hypothetical protein